MKKFFLLFAAMILLVSLSVSAEGNDGGLLPLEQAIFSGISSVEESGWSAEGGELSLQKTGGLAGNNYLQFDLPARGAGTLSFNAAPYLNGSGIHTISFYLRFSALTGTESLSLKMRVGDKTFFSDAQTVEANRWTRFSIAFEPAGDTPLVLEIPEGLCTKVCLDALTLTVGGITQTGDKTVPKATNKPTEPVEQKASLSAETKKAVTWAIVFASAGIVAAIAILLVPSVPLPVLNRLWKKRSD